MASNRDIDIMGNFDSPSGTSKTWSRRGFLRLFGLAAGGLAVPGILAACGGESATPTPESQSGGGAPTQPAATSTQQATSTAAETTETGQIVIGVTGGGLSHDPAKTTAIEDWARIQNMYNGLLRYQPGGFELEPDLAEKWEISADGIEYTLPLKQGVQFHKGYGEVTAEDVKFSIDRQLDPDFAAVTRSQLALLDRVEVVDTYTIKLTLTRASVPFLALFAFGRPAPCAVISKKAAEELGNDNYTEHPIGTGPFIYESEIPNQSVTLVRNDAYHEGPAKPSGLETRTIADEATLSLAIERGEVHLANISSSDTILKYEDGSKAQLFVGDRMNVAGLLLNTTIPPFDDARVRRALAYAVNTAELVEGVYAGYALRPSPGYVHPKMFGYDDSLKPIEYDPERAKRELADLGIENLTIDCVTYSGSSWATVGALLQQQFAAAGVTFNLQQLERGVLTRRREAPDQPSCIISFTSTPEPHDILSSFGSDQIPPGGLNTPRYTGIDDLLKQEEVEQDEAKRAEILKQIQQKLAQDLPMIPFWHQQGVVLGALGLTGFTPDPLGGFWVHGVSLS